MRPQVRAPGERLPARRSKRLGSPRRSGRADWLEEIIPGAAVTREADNNNWNS